jgi:hypothetical protein
MRPRPEPKYEVVVQDAKDEASRQLMAIKDDEEKNSARLLAMVENEDVAEIVAEAPSRYNVGYISDDESIAPPEGEPLEEDLYGASITSLLRDMHNIWLSPTKEGCCFRCIRVATTMFALIATILFAMFILAQTKILITPDIVKDVRQKYSDYERWMYNNHTVLTMNGFHRGIPEYFDPKRFSSMPHDMKETICGIPLAHPYFCYSVLALWTFTVVVDIRTVFSLTRLMIFRVNTVTSVEHMFTDEDGNHVSNWTGRSGKVNLEGLTWCFKAILMLVIFLPRICLDMFLLYLGWRWLIASNFNTMIGF